MKREIVIGIVLFIFGFGCGGGIDSNNITSNDAISSQLPILPQYQCHFENFGVVASEFPLDCEKVQYNIDLVYSILKSKFNIDMRFNIPVIMRDVSNLGQQNDGKSIYGTAHNCPNSKTGWIELNRDIFSLFHEVCHFIYGPGHQNWDKLAIYDGESEFGIQMKSIIPSTN